MNGCKLLALLVTFVLLLPGCLEVREPLLVIDGDNESAAPTTRDPAPGVPDDQLTLEQRYQRDLARCQQLLKMKKEDAEEQKDRRKRAGNRHEDETEKLEDQVKYLQKENRELRKELRDIRK